MTTAGSGAEAARIARGLAYVCGHLAELRALLEDDGADPSKSLSRLVSALQAPSAGAQAGPDIAALLGQVQAAVQALGDAVGIYGYSRRGTGQSGMEALQIVYRCPLQRCAGRPAETITEPEPKCSVSGARLIRDRL